MIISNDITVTDIDLAAALMVVTGEKPFKIAPGCELVEFTFTRNELTEQTAINYVAGKLVLEVRSLAKCRSWLYRQIRDVETSGTAVIYG